MVMEDKGKEMERRDKEMEEIAEGIRNLGGLGGPLPANVKPIPKTGGPTLHMFRPTRYREIQDPKEKEEFNRIVQKMRLLGLFDDDDGPYGPQGTLSYTTDGCFDDSDP